MSSIENFVRPSKPPKYFAVDIDGTFLAADPKIYEKNRRVFRKLIEAGYVPFFCTGRPHQGVLNELHELDTDGIYKGFPGVYQNGGTVYNHKGELVGIRKFDQAFIRKFCAAMEAADVGTYSLLCTQNEIYTMTEVSQGFIHMSQYFKFNRTPTYIPKEELVEKEILQIYTVCYNLFGSHVDWEDGKDCVIKYGEFDITAINPPGITKEIGLKSLLDVYQVDIEDCGYIGDGENDTEAMRASNMSFAVGNAPEIVKSHAKYVLKETNEEGGFYKAIGLVYGINVD